MKKILALITLGGLLAAATAQAQVEIYITGATAFRANAYRSIRSLLATGGSYTETPGGSSANRITWSGTIPALFGAQAVTIYANYSGSVEGVGSISQNALETYLATDGVTTFTHLADLAFSDVFQSSTIYKTPTLADEVVGVQPFIWAKSAGAPAGLTNITIQQINAFLPNGLLPTSYFTGNAADDAGLTYLLGRDSGSGTRMTVERDSKYKGSVLLWYPNASCVWGLTNGFSSGGTVRSYLNNSACGSSIGYIGVADARNLTSPDAQILSYDGGKPFFGAVGVAGTVPDWTPVRKGLYSCWSYEHLFMRTTASANVSSFRASLKSAINTDLTTSDSAIQVSTMQVGRNADGGPISPL